jgi:hypothetical protein
MGAVVAVNLAVIGLPEMLVVAFAEEDKEEDQTKEEWATPRLNRLCLRPRQLRQQRRQPREVGV